MHVQENTMNTKTKIIMLSGWMGSGKDCIAKILVEQYGYTRFAFADMVKDEVAKLYHIPRELMDTHEGKSTVIGERTVRQYLIDHAEACRCADAQCWARPVCKQIIDRKIKKAVISDWRMFEEYLGIRKVFQNVTTVRINRWTVHPAHPHIDPTESALDQFPFQVIFNNSGNLNDLKQWVEQFNMVLNTI